MLKRLLVASATFAILSIGAQEHKFTTEKEVTVEDLRRRASAISPGAPAEVLYSSVRYVIDGDKGVLHCDIVSKIKIFDKSKADEFLTHEIPIYDFNNRREYLLAVKAATYNLDGDRIQVDRVSKDAQFSSKEDRHYTINKLTFPSVQDGSVVEVKYRIESPFIYQLPKVFIERSIPIAYTEYSLEAPDNVAYNINYNGNLVPQHRHITKQSQYERSYTIYRFGYENIPAFEKEEYVLNANNYRTSIGAELNSTNFTELKRHASTWDQVRKNLLDDGDFGKQLKKSIPANLLPPSITEEPLPLKKVEKLLAFIQDNYVWNGEYGIFTKKGVRDVMQNKSGNVAEINLLLVMLLRKSGLNAQPVVLSAVNNGWLSYNPSVSQLNYVIAAVNIAGKQHLLDATSKQSLIDMLPPRAYNYSAVVLGEKEAKKIELLYTGQSETRLTVDAELHSDGSVKGRMSDYDTNLYAMLSAEAYNSDPAAYEKQYREKYNFTLTDIKPVLQQNRDFETTFKFDHTKMVDKIGDRLIINPMLFLATEENNFAQKKERKAALEFVTGSIKVKTVNLTIPEGYKVSALPSGKRIVTEDRELSYEYRAEQRGNKIIIIATTTIKRPFYEKEFYPAFQQVWDMMGKQESQLITLTKI